MQVLNYLKNKTMEQLSEEYGIKVSRAEGYPNLYVLNYNQIESPKTHPIVKECRSLVLGSEDGKSFEVVSRSFDRFFNYNEDGYSPDMSTLSCVEKVDGSLVGVFYYKGEWVYRTKSMVMPLLSVQGFETTWNNFIEDALCWSNIDFSSLDKEYTYILEVVGRENRVVVQYPERKAYALAARNNNTGEYSDLVTPTQWLSPKKYSFDSTEDCMAMVRELPNLEEGYVAYDEMGVPRVKIKSPAYIAAHRLRGDGLTPSRIAEMVVSNEYDEYLAIFKEDTPFFTPYIESWTSLKEQLVSCWERNKGVLDKKQFALAVKDNDYSAVLFQFKNNEDSSIEHTLHMQKTSYKVKLLLKAYKQED